MHVPSTVLLMSAALLLSRHLLMTDAVLWWAMLFLPSRGSKFPWPLAFGVVVSSCNVLVPTTTVFAAACLAAYSAEVYNNHLQ